MIGPSRIEESSLRYPGWRVALACFLVEMFLFGFGLYGHALYLAELQRLHGWPTALISTASTLSFLLGSVLGVFANDALVRMGPKRLLLAGLSALAASTMLLAFTTTPWQLFTAYILMAFGWMGMGTVVLSTTMAVIGRLCLGLFVDRLDPRLATAASVLSQAAALFAIAYAADTTILFVACAVYGFSIGNLITLPPLIIHREFEPTSFGTVLGLSTGIVGIISAFGPGLVGLIRGATGGYAAALMLCVLLKLASAAIVLLRPGRAIV